MWCGAAQQIARTCGGTTCDCGVHQNATTENDQRKWSGTKEIVIGRSTPPLSTLSRVVMCLSQCLSVSVVCHILQPNIKSRSKSPAALSFYVLFVRVLFSRSVGVFILPRMSYQPNRITCIGCFFVNRKPNVGWSVRGVVRCCGDVCGCDDIV